MARSSPARPDLADCSWMLGLDFTNLETTSMFAGLSSMYSTRTTPAPGLAATARAAGTASSGTWMMSGALGRVTVNDAPSPTVLDAESCPPIARARASASGSPIPVPSIPDCSAPSRSNGTKIRSRFASDMPGPVSVTTTLTRSWPSDRQRIETAPSWRLYLIALLTRFSRI